MDINFVGDSSKIGLYFYCCSGELLLLLVLYSFILCYYNQSSMNKSIKIVYDLQN